MADATKRMNYFDRQFLRAQDLLDEQSYHLDRRRRHNAGFHSSGVAQGLEVVASGVANEVNITAGWAVDALGQEIVLAAPRNNVPTGGSDVEISIAYPQLEPLSDPSTDPGITGFTRVSEEPVVTVVPPGTVPANAIQLATVSAAGVIDNTVRLSAGLKDGVVTEPKLADNAVSTRTIQDAAVTEPKLANNAVSTRTTQNGAVTEPKLADNAVSKRAIQKGAVSIAQLLVELIVDNVEVSVPKAPGAGRFGQETVNIPGNGDEHAFYLISVHFVRFVTSQQSSTVDFDWKQRVTLTQNPLQPRVQELVIQNSNTDDGIIVSCKVYRLAEK